MSKSSKTVAGGRSPTQLKGATIAAALKSSLVFELDPFELFCAYHLGITAENTYRFQNVHDVAKRFGSGPGEVKQALQEYGMDPDTVLNAKFNMAVAQVDIQVAPPGVDLKTIAQMHYEEFLASPKKARDWSKELAEDEQVNDVTYKKKR